MATRIQRRTFPGLIAYLQTKNSETAGQSVIQSLNDDKQGGGTGRDDLF